MTTAYTSLLGLALPVTGELSGTWGNTVNTEITSLLDSAIAGTTTISADADITLTTTTGAANESREAIILWTAGGTTTRNITAPAQSKAYIVINKSSSTQSIVLRGAGPTTGVTIIKGEAAVCAWNGSDFIKVSNTSGSGTFSNLTVTGTTTLSGLTASTALALDASKNVVSVTNTGTGNNVLSASPTLTGTVAGASLSLSSLTSGRVTFATTAGLLTDSANLLWDGTTFGVTGRLYNGSASTFGASSWAMSLGNGGISANYFKADSTYWQNAAGTQTMQLSGGILTTANDASINGLTVGRGAGAVGSNTVVGASALTANTSGVGNTAVGLASLAGNTSGADNAAFGYASLQANTSGVRNSAFGGSGVGFDGIGVLGGNTSGSDNAAFGNRALKTNTTGSFNTALGSNALLSNTTASNNTAVGYQAGYSNTTGTNNTYLGNQAAYANLGSFGVFIGNQAGYGTASTAGVTQNVGIGHVSLTSLTTGVQNNAVGNSSLQLNTTGSYNAAMGHGSLGVNTTGANNTAMGNGALASNTTASNNTAVGYQAAYSNTTGFNTAVGVTALYSNTTGGFNTAIGGGTVGFTGGALYANTTGAYNIAVGTQALGNNTTASNNTAVGYRPLYSNTTGQYNTAMGKEAGFSNTTGQANAFFGYQAGYSCTGDGNTFVGAAGSGPGGSGYLVTTGSRNVILGAYTGSAAPISATGSNYIVLSDGDGNVRGTFDSSGNLLVGTTSRLQTEKLTVLGAEANQMVYLRNSNATPGGIFVDYSVATPNNTGNEFLYCTDASAQRMAVRSNGGIANYSANDVNLSDRREKTNFAPAKSYLDVICAIPVQTFNYIDQNLEEDGGLTLGVVAQDVQAVAPEFVIESNWGTKEAPKVRLSIYQTDLQYALMKAIQELKAEFDAYKSTHP
jgi:hypothetical protein